MKSPNPKSLLLKVPKPCVFCSIIEGADKGHVVFQDDHTIAILDIHPLFPRHVLLMPKEHVVLFMDLSKELGNRLFENTQLIAKGVQAAMQCEGIFIANNNVVSQSVPHVHIHIVPRNKKDGLHGFFYPRRPYLDEAHMEEVRATIAIAIKKI